MPNPFFIKLRQLIIIILAQYLIFTDVVVGLVFKPLLDTSERDVPVIFGNILTETEDRQGGGSKGEKKTRPEYDPVYLQQHFNHLLGTNLVTCPFANYSLLIRCSPIKETHPEARFCDSVADSLVTHPHTHPPTSNHLHINSPNASLCL